MLRQKAAAAIQLYADSRHKVGYALRLAGIYQAAYGAGIENVIINEPTADVVLGPAWAVYVDEITVDHRIIK
jgi:phage-related baseplate assembly protein